MGTWTKSTGEAQVVPTEDDTGVVEGSWAKHPNANSGWEESAPPAPGFTPITTADIDDSANRRYVTDSQRGKLHDPQMGDGSSITGAGTTQDPFVAHMEGVSSVYVDGITITGAGTLNDPLVAAPQGSGGVTSHITTYAELADLIALYGPSGGTEGGMVLGDQYIITDYRMRHGYYTAPAGVWSYAVGAERPLAVTAISPTEIDEHSAFFVDDPSLIIHYTLSNDRWTNNNGPDHGIIYYLEDPYKRNFAEFDWQSSAYRTTLYESSDGSGVYDTVFEGTFVNSSVLTTWPLFKPGADVSEWGVLSHRNKAVDGPPGYIPYIVNCADVVHKREKDHGTDTDIEICYGNNTTIENHKLGCCTKINLHIFGDNLTVSSVTVSPYRNLTGTISGPGPDPDGAVVRNVHCFSDVRLACESIVDCIFLPAWYDTAVITGARRAENFGVNQGNIGKRYSYAPNPGIPITKTLLDDRYLPAYQDEFQVIGSDLTSVAATIGDGWEDGDVVLLMEVGGDSMLINLLGADCPSQPAITVGDLSEIVSGEYGFYWVIPPGHPELNNSYLYARNNTDYLPLIYQAGGWWIGPQTFLQLMRGSLPAGRVSGLGSAAFANTEDFAPAGSVGSQNLYEFSGGKHYCGTAPAGSATSDAVWLIHRLTITGTVLDEVAADVAWDDRLTTTYA